MFDYGSTVLCLGFLGLLLHWLLKKSPLSSFPSRPGLPLLGNVFQIKSKRPDKTFMEWQKELGGVFCIKLFNRSILIANSSEVIQEILVKKGEDFAGRSTTQAYRTQTLSYGFQDVVFSNPSPRTRFLRKFTQKNIKTYDTGMKRIEAVSLKAIKTLVEQFKGVGGRSFDPQPTIQNCVMNVLTTFLVNRTYTKDDDLFQLSTKVEQLVTEVFPPSGAGKELDMFPWLRFFGNKTYKKLITLMHLRVKLWQLLKSHGLQEAATDHEFPGLIRALLEESSKDESDLEEIHVRLLALNLISAGISTSTTSLYTFLNIVSQHPEIQRKLQTEVDTVIGKERWATLNDKQLMPYTQATLYELLRYNSSVPIINHQSLTETTLDGKQVPPRADVFCNMWALHHDESFWDAPYEFKPERFLDNNGQLVEPLHENRRHLMAFGAGPRVCLGEIFALNRLFLFMVSMVQRFEIEQGAIKSSCDARDYDHGFVIKCQPFEIIAKERI